MIILKKSFTKKLRAGLEQNLAEIRAYLHQYLFKKRGDYYFDTKYGENCSLSYRILRHRKESCRCGKTVIIDTVLEYEECLCTSL